MILRRTYALPPLPGDNNRPECVITFDTASGELIVGHRHNGWDEWSRPLDVLTADDDEPLPGDRGYAPGGRTYPADGTVEIGGQVMTQAQYDAARLPLMAVPPEELDAPGPDAGGPVPADAESDD